MGAQAPVAADMWRVPAATLARPAPLESGATARFWNPAARAGGRGLNVGIQVFETSDAVGLSGLLVGVTRTLGRHLEVGIILGRLQIRDLVRTGTSPVAQLGTIPVYEQVGGATLAAGLGRVKSAVMIRGHDARFDQFREGGVTADIGVSFEITPRLTVAAATHFLPVDVQSRESTSYLAALEYVLWTPSLWGRRSSVTGRYGTTARDRGGLDHAFGAGSRSKTASTSMPPTTVRRTTPARCGALLLRSRCGWGDTRSLPRGAAAQTMWGYVPRRPRARPLSVNLLDVPPNQARDVLAAWARERELPGYRVRQIVPRLWRRPVAVWSELTDLPQALRTELERQFPLARLRLVTRQTSRDGTMKFLWGLADGAAIESVLIPEGARRTLCVSSQVGCAFGCTFCATGRMGFQRHLAPWEIAAQVRELALDPEIGRPTNVVFMGMGEPLHNWPAVDVALTILNGAQGLGIGARHITVSTVGIIPALAKLAARPEQFRLALSLHAPTSDRRRPLIPVERKYALADVLSGLRAFRRRVTFEYVLIHEANDTLEDADALAAIANPLTPW